MATMIESEICLTEMHYHAYSLSLNVYLNFARDFQPRPSP